MVKFPSLHLQLFNLLVGVVLGQQTQTDDSTTSVIIIMGFLAVILLLSGIGIICSYLCYRRSERQAKQHEQGLLQRSLRPLEANSLNRGIPNWYGPAPDAKSEESAQLTEIREEGHHHQPPR